MNLRFASIKILLPLVLLVSSLPGPAAGKKAVAPRPRSLRLVPDDVTLWGDKASQHFLVLARYADGLERDVTARARFSLSDPDKGQIDSSGKFVARAGGQLVLRARFAGRKADAAIRIEEAGERRPFSFAREIGGIFTKRGCNSSGCHGGVKGRGGYKLSLDSFYPKEDYAWTVEGGTYQVLSPEPKGTRVSRINREHPERSLLLEKATMEVAHGGGEQFAVGTPDYEAILAWIRAGAPYGEEADGRRFSIERIEVFPQQVVLEPEGRHQLLVTAYLVNGRREDITEEVLYVSNAPDIVEVDENGFMRAGKPGEAAILIHAVGQVASAGVGVIAKPVASYPKVRPRNYIDQFVLAKLRKLHIVPSELSSDEEFLRRVCLDLTGTLPPLQRVREFLADEDPRKRDWLIETLLNTPEYVDYWGFRFSDLMRVTFVTSNDTKALKGYEDWVVRSIASNKPYDQMARERIAAQGYGAPTGNFFYVTWLMAPEVVMPELVRVFMGRRFECAQCHNHPFEAWSQNQFWGLAAFFGGLSELKDSKLVIDVLGGGHVDQPKEMKVIHPRTKQKVVPAFLDGTKLPEDQWMDPRLRLAEWMTTHPYFAEATVNRIWSYFFGRGIVEPVDDFRTTNPPTHPELLEALAGDFQDSGYDLKHLLRTIVQSRSYQLSGTPKETHRDDRTNYARARPRPLEAAVLLDAISTATGVPEKFEYHYMAGGGDPPPGARAMQMIPDLCPSQFLDAFGRSMRKTPPGGPPQPSLAQALHMLAGPTYTTKISEPGGRLDRLLNGGASDEEIVEEFYLVALTRFPTQRERAALLEFLRQRPSRRRETLEGLVWAVISSREFTHNH